MYSIWNALHQYIAELLGISEAFEEDDEELGEQPDANSGKRPIDVVRSK